MCDKYNAWSNYQTWVFNLWNDNAFSDEADDFYHSNDNDFDAIRALEGYIKEFAEERNPFNQEDLTDGFGMPVSDASVWTDLLGHAIGMIDFFEIAAHYIDEIISYNGLEIREKVFS